MEQKTRQRIIDITGGVAVIGVILGISCWSAIRSMKAEDAGQAAADVALQRSTSNLEEFRKNLLFASFVASVEKHKDNQKAVIINLERTWDTASMKQQEIARNMWLNTWYDLNNKNPTRSEEELEVVIFHPGVFIPEILKVPKEER